MSYASCAHYLYVLGRFPPFLALSMPATETFNIYVLYVKSVHCFVSHITYSIARFIIMPRKPTRPRQLLRSQPITFSRFARSVALASVYKVKRQIRNSKTSRKVSPISSGNYNAINYSTSDLPSCCLPKVFFVTFFDMNILT